MLKVEWTTKITINSGCFYKCPEFLPDRKVLTEEIEELNWGLAYFDRYVKLFGNPINQQIWDREGYNSLQILTFAPSDDLLIFATIGLTLYEQEPGGVFEVFLAAGDWARQIPNILGRSLTAMVEKSQKPGVGVSFKGLDKIFPDFSEKTGKTALYFTKVNGLEGLDTVSLGGTEKGKLLTAFFISAAEQEFLETNGAEKFEAALQEAGVVPANLNRKSIF